MSKRPNVLLLFSDQHKASVMGDHPDVATPHLDRLAAGGTQFSRAYCQDAVCVPSRCSLFSGLYPRTFGSFDFRHMKGCYNDLSPYYAPMLDGAAPIQQVFQQQGYATAAFGKRHMHEPCDRGWDVSASHLPDESPDDNYSLWVKGLGYGDEAARDWAAELGQGLDGTLIDGKKDQFALLATRESRLPAHATMEAFTAMRTRQFLEERSRDQQPFFCYSSFYRPHQPYTPLKKFWDRHDRSRWGKGTNAGDAIRMPSTLREDTALLPPMMRSWFDGKNRVWRLDLARENEQLYRDYVSAYYALVEEIDSHVGAILGDLADLGLADDTIVVYASDHGDFVGSHGMVEKCAGGHNVFEDTLRVPMIFRWPGQIRGNAVCEDLAELVDIYPSLLRLCGVSSPPQTLDGKSLADTLRQGTRIDREFCVSENWSQATVITKRYKLGHWRNPFDPAIHFDFRGFGDMLFDREEDPDETNNIFRLAPASLRSKLAGMLESWDGEHPFNPPAMPDKLRPMLEATFAACTKD